ncbi:hypothetical protein [Kineosporia sp. NBRC 101731]|nr:hypothetical protein [Kineosporia sp. NBRC 101731]
MAHRRDHPGAGVGDAVIRTAAVKSASMVALRRAIDLTWPYSGR